MSREPTKLCMDKYLKQTGDNEWTVIRPIVYLFDGYIGLIPVGFKTDICSHVPNCDWWYACVVHDWLYTLADYIACWWIRILWRWVADYKLAKLICVISKRRFKFLWAVIYFTGVRLFGVLVYWSPNEESKDLVQHFAKHFEEYRKISVWVDS